MTVPKPIIAAAIASSLVIATPFIAEFEGKRNDPYRDIVGVQTVCYGETRVKMKRYTDAECKALLEEAVGEFSENVLKVNPNLAYHPKKLAAATSLAYNIGMGNYGRSTVAREFNKGNYVKACEAFKNWKMVTKNGKKVVSNGLVNRRMKEYKLCLG